MELNCRSCSKSFTSRRQLCRHFNEVHGDILKCNFCEKTVPGTRKYLMEEHITKYHGGKPISLTVIKRDNFRNPGACQTDFSEQPRKIISRRSPRKSPRKSHKRPHVRQKSMESHSSPVVKTPGGPSTPNTQVGSPSFSLPLSIPMADNLYEVNPASPERRVLRRSPLSNIPLSSPSQPRALISPFSRVPSGIVSANGDASSTGMRKLSKDATETASSDVIPSVFPGPVESPSLFVPLSSPMEDNLYGPVLSPTETDKTDDLCLFSMPGFEFFSDFECHLKASSPNGAQESSLSAKPAVKPSLAVPTNQAKLVSVSSVPAPATSSQSTVARKTIVNNPPNIIHTTESSPPSYQSEDLVNDSQFFFAGAPSFEKNDFVASLLQSTNLEAQRQGGRKVSWLPQGSFAIERREELHFPDGRQYCLSSTICRNPHYTTKIAKSTQTDFSTASSSSSSKCNVGTQVSTTFTLSD